MGQDFTAINIFGWLLLLNIPRRRAFPTSVRLCHCHQSAREALQTAACLAQLIGQHHSCTAFCSNALSGLRFLVCHRVNYMCLLCSLTGED